MPQTNHGDKPTHQDSQPPRDWIDYGAFAISSLTLIVLTFTLVEVWRYTRASQEANRLTTIALRANDERTQTELRAYVMPMRISLVGFTAQERAASRIPTMIVQIKSENAGKTPATDSTVCLDDELVDISNAKPGTRLFDLIPPYAQCPTRCRGNLSFIPNGASDTTTMVLENLTEEQTRDVLSSPATKLFLIHGCVIYKDVFGHPHCTSYCGLYASAPLLVQCGYGLDTCKAPSRER